MQRLWSADELGERWTLLPEDLALLADLPDTGKLGLAAQLAYWRQHGRFPDDEADLAPAVVGHLAAPDRRRGRRARRLRLGWPHRPSAPPHDPRPPRGRRLRRRGRGRVPPLARRRAAAARAGAGGAGGGDRRLVRARAGSPDPARYRLDRILRSARAAHDDAALQRVADRLDAGMRERLDALLADDGEGTAFARLVADPGRVGLESLLAEIDKLELLRGLGAAAGPAARPSPGPGQALPPTRGRRERLGAAPTSRAHPPAAARLLAASRARPRWSTAWSSC